MKRQLHLNLFIYGRGHHEAAWRHPRSLLRAKLLEAAQDPVGGTAEAFGYRMREDFEKYGRLVKELEIKMK